MYISVVLVAVCVVSFSFGITNRQWDNFSFSIESPKVTETDLVLVVVIHREEIIF